MDIIQKKDIDFSKLEKMSHNGVNSDIYIDGDKCIKIFKGLPDIEKYCIQEKFSDMEGIKIKNALLPNGLIIEDGKLEGTVTDYFKNSQTFYNHFLSGQYVDVKKMFAAVKEASLILREIHENGIICQDLNFDNILIDNNGVVKYVDFEGCSFRENNAGCISLLIKRYLIDYKKAKLLLVSKRLDRVSLFLSFIVIGYLKELQKLNYKQYHALSDQFKTFDNMRYHGNLLLERGNYIPDVPYLDELIDDNDEGYINRANQISFVKKLFMR